MNRSLAQIKVPPPPPPPEEPPPGTRYDVIVIGTEVTKHSAWREQMLSQEDGVVSREDVVLSQEDGLW